MPLLWRELLKRYFRPFLLSVCTFIALLLVVRFETIARFIVTGASVGGVIWFVFHQCFSILPLAIALSSLIASFSVMQQMSLDSELIALRSAGFSLSAFLFPLLLTGGCLSCLVLAIVAEIAPHSRLHTKALLSEIIEANPLSVLQKGSLVKLKDCFIDIQKKESKHIEEMILVFPIAEKLHVIMAEKIGIKGKKVLGENVALIGSFDKGQKEGFDSLWIENQQSLQAETALCSAYLSSDPVSMRENKLTLRMLFAASSSAEEIQKEIFKRFSLIMAVMTFTLLGLSYGISIGRERKIKQIAMIVLFVGFYFVCFVAARSFRKIPFLMGTLFFFPHILMLCFSMRALYKIKIGK